MEADYLDYLIIKVGVILKFYSLSAQMAQTNQQFLM